MREPMYLRNLVIVLMGVIPCSGSASTLPFYDGFDDGDYDGWAVEAPSWVSGLEVEPPDVVAWDDGSGYYLRGVGEGYCPPPGWQTWLLRPISASAVGELTVEMRARAGASWPNQTSVCVNNGLDYYRLRDYGEAGENETADWIAMVAGSEDLYRYYIGAMAFEWHTYRWSRDANGWWSLYIDDILEWGDFVQDTQLTAFDSIAIVLDRQDSCIDWVSVTPEPGALALLVLGGVTFMKRR